MLPFAGVRVVLLYLILFSVYRHWGVGTPTAGSPTDVKTFYFDVLFSLRGNLGATVVAGLDNSITAKQVVIWGYATGLVGLSLLGSILISGYVIWNAPRELSGARRWMAMLGILALALVVYPYISNKIGVFDRFTVVAKHFWYLINTQLTPDDRMFNLVNIEVLVVALGYGVSMVLAFASSATLLPLRELNQSPPVLDTARIEDGAKYVAKQMKHLRLILYAGAILLVLITFRHRATLNWALDYLKPTPLLESNPNYKFANVLYEHLATLTTNIVTATSVLNTLLLAALYVPSALLLQRRAVELAAVAIELENMPKAAPVDAKPIDQAGVEPRGPGLNSRWLVDEPRAGLSVSRANTEGNRDSESATGGTNRRFAQLVQIVCLIDAVVS
jgi:hypothetical protein